MSVAGFMSNMGKMLYPTDGTEYIFVNIYRIQSKDTGTEARSDLVKFLKNFRGSGDQINNTTKHIASFSTILNNDILGLQVENASVYGSKIEMAFEDGDFRFSKLIRKNDIIIIHRIPSNLARFFDVITSVFGVSALPTSIAGKKIEKVGDSLISRYTGIKTYGQKMILKDNEPIFSGLITKASIVSHGSTQFRLDAQDMIRILQQINTDDIKTTTYASLPTNTDDYFINEASTKTNAKQTTYSSDLLHTLAMAVKYHITVTGEEIADQIEVKTLDEYNNSTITDVNKIYIIKITDSVYLFGLNPILAARCYLTYFTKETGMRNYFNFNIFHQTKEMYAKVLKLVEETHANSASTQNPLIMFGAMFSDSEYTDHQNSNWTSAQVYDFLTKNTTQLKYVFTETTMSLLFDYQITEYVVTRAFNTKERKKKDITADELVRTYFWSLIGGITGGDFDATAEFSGGKVFYENTDKDKWRINPKAIDQYIGNIGKVMKAFNKSISFSFLFNTRIRNLRSAKYNPLVKNQQSSIPMIQVIQLLVGAINGLPLSQSKSTGSQIDASYDISQRIWLQSKIGFGNKDNKPEWYSFSDEEQIPTIYITIQYGEVQKFSESNITLLEHIMEYEFYDLPSNGKFSVYTGAGSGQEVPIIAYIDKGADNTEPTFSLGSILNFNFQNIYGKDILQRYQSENLFPQVGAEAIKTIPRKALMVLTKGTDVNKLKAADKDFESSLSSLASPIQIGHDIRKYHEGTFANADMFLQTPVVKSNSSRTTEVVNMFATNGMPTGANAKFQKVGAVTFPEEDEQSFPSAENTCVFNEGTYHVITTGVRKYYDVLAFLPIVQRYLDYMDIGFKGYNGDGDVNVNKYKDGLVVLTNLKFSSANRYVKFVPDRETTVFNMITELKEFIQQFRGEEAQKYMMLKYATKVTGIETKKFRHGNEAMTTRADQVRTKFIAENLLQYEIPNPDGQETILAIAGVVFSLSHYMNRLIAQSTIGGVLYIPTSFKGDGTQQFDDFNKSYVNIGDALQFVPDKDSTVWTMTELVQRMGKGLKNLFEKFSPQTRKNRLDLFRKPFYVWKVVSYFGGSSTSGTSGSTQRVYITDSGLQWRTSYEEDNITSRIAESIKLRGLDVPSGAEA